MEILGTALSSLHPQKVRKWPWVFRLAGLTGATYATGLVVENYFFNDNSTIPPELSGIPGATQWTMADTVLANALRNLYDMSAYLPSRIKSELHSRVNQEFLQLVYHASSLVFFAVQGIPTVVGDLLRQLEDKLADDTQRRYWQRLESKFNTPLLSCEARVNAHLRAACKYLRRYLIRAGVTLIVYESRSEAALPPAAAGQDDLFRRILGWLPASAEAGECTLSLIACFDAHVRNAHVHVQNAQHECFDLVMQFTRCIGNGESNILANSKQADPQRVHKALLERLDSKSHSAMQKEYEQQQKQFAQALNVSTLYDDAVPRFRL